MNSVIDLETLKKFIQSDENNKNFKLNGSYLIERVIYLNDLNALDYLLNNNASIIIPQLMKNPIKFNNKEIIDKLFHYSSQTYEIIDNKKHNAFHYAIHYFNNYVIDYLIDKINLFSLDYYNNTYLHYAIKKKNNYVIEKLIDKIFKERNIDNMNNSLINIFNIINNNNDCILLLMIKNKINYRINEIIDDLYVNLNIQNKDYEFILYYVCINLNYDLFKQLLYTYNYVNWNLQDKEGNTFIHILIKFKKYAYLKFLKLNNIDINLNIYNIDFETPLITLLKNIKKNIKLFNDLKNIINIMCKLSSPNITDKKGNNYIYYLLKYFDFFCYEINNNPIDNIINNKGISLKDIDKKNIFKYNETKNKNNLLNIKYSSLPFDILCYLINLSIDNNVYINIDFNKININDTLNVAILNYFILWNREIHNLDLLNSINDFKKSNKKYMILFILIEFNNFNHCNILIINDNTIYRFDPYGYYYHDEYNLDDLDKILNNKVQELNKKYNFNYNYNYFDKQIGIQQLENKFNKNINDLNGYCISWCMMVVNEIILNNISQIDYIIILFNNKNYYEYKLKYTQEFANKFRDIILLDCEIPFIKYYNNDLTINESKKIIESMKKVIKLYKKN